MDLRTGELLGPAKPAMLITQSVPHEYNPDVDITRIAEMMQTFFPEPCYPGSYDFPKSSLSEGQLRGAIVHIRGAMLQRGGQLCDCGGVANVQSEARSAEEMQMRGLKGH